MTAVGTSKRPVIGLIVPSSNPTVERALQALGVCRQLGADFVVTRVSVTDVSLSPSSLAQFGAGPMSRAAALLADTEPELIVWAGTSGLWRGRDAEDRELAEMALAGGCASTSSRRALLAALDEESGPVGLLTPYTAAVHGAVLDHLLAERVDVVESKALEVEENLAFARLAPELLEDAALGLSAGGSRRVVVACTNVMVVVPGVMVVDSLLATLWHSARLAGSTRKSYREFYLLAGGSPVQ